MTIVDLDEKEIAHTYIGRVRRFMRDFGLGERSPVELENALLSAGLLLVDDPKRAGLPVTNGERA